jgi:hypothetical protein
MMSTTSETPVTQRQILLVGPYGVLGTGVIDAVAANPQWGVTTAARRPAPAYRAQPAPPHISVDLMDREGTKNAFSSLDVVTDLVFAAPRYVKMVSGRDNNAPSTKMSSFSL